MVPSCNHKHERLTVKMLGNFQVMLPDGSILHFPSTQCKILLAILVCARGKWLSRPNLSMMLFPKDGRNGQKRFATELWRLRKVLKNAGCETWIQNSTSGLRLHPDFPSNIDSYQLDNIYRSVTLRETVDESIADEVFTQSQGAFLADLEGEWIAPVREEFDRKREDIAYYLLDCKQIRRDWRAVQEIAQLMLSQEPYDEQALRALLDAYSKQGKLKFIRAIYDDFRSRLATDLGVRPEMRTEKLVQKLTGHRTDMMVQNQQVDERNSHELVLFGQKLRVSKEFARDLRRLADLVENAL